MGNTPGCESRSLAELVLADDEPAVLACLKAMGTSEAAAEITNSEFGLRGAKSPLHCAAQCGHASILRHFLSYNVDPDIVDDACKTPLHFAVEFGHARAAYLLLKVGAKADAGNGFGRTPEELAEEQDWDTPYISEGKAHIRKMLEGHFESFDSLPPEPPGLPAGRHTVRGTPTSQPNVEAEDVPPAFFKAGSRRMLAGSETHPLLAELVKTGDVSVVKARLKDLMDAGGPEAVQREVTNCEEGLHDARIAQSAMHVTARRGYVDILKILLSTKANPNVTNDQWNTPLHLAAESGQLRAVEVLIEAGADPMVQNGFGRTAEELASLKPYDTSEVEQGKAKIQAILRKLT